MMATFPVKADAVCPAAEAHRSLIHSFIQSFTTFIGYCAGETDQCTVYTAPDECARERQRQRDRELLLYDIYLQMALHMR